MIIRRIAMVLALTIGLAGCGDSGGDGSATATPETTPTPATTSTPAPPAGTLDLSLGATGFSVTDFEGRGDVANDLAIQPDGKIVVVGYSDPGDSKNAFATARYLSDGTLDPTFGDGGRVLTSPDGSTFADATDVVLAPDGKIVVAGSRSKLGTAGAVWQIVRYDAAGRLDPSFGTGGVLSVLPSGGGPLAGIALQPDGLMVAAGTISGSRRTFAIMRLQGDGTPDPNFGDAGLVTINIGQDSQLSALALEADGKIVLGGSADGVDQGPRPISAIALVRLLPDGTLDHGFGSGGIVVTEVTPPGQRSRLLDLTLRDGQIIACGFGGLAPDLGHTPLFLVRYLSDGVPDESFGTGGILQTAIAVDESSATLVQPDGTILIGGSTRDSPRASIIRLTATGAIDESFADGGRFAQQVRPGDDSAIRSLAVDSAGRLVAAGYSQLTLNGLDFAVGRLFLGESAP